MANQNRQLLKKRAQRRELYLGENVRAFLVLGGARIVGGEVISLSESGLAFVCEPQFDAELPIGRVLQLKLYYDARRFFITTVEIRNKSVFTSQGSQYLRVGVSAVPPFLGLRLLNQCLLPVMCLEQPLSRYHCSSWW